jgi:hypothetical protein
VRRLAWRATPTNQENVGLSDKGPGEILPAAQTPKGYGKYMYKVLDDGMAFSASVEYPALV